MMRKYANLSVVLSILLMLVLSACAPAAPAPAAQEAAAPAAQVQAEPAAQTDDQLDIILVAHAASAWDSFWKVVEQGNHDAAEDFNVNLTILAPDKWCPECVVKLIDQAVAAKPDAIGITVSDGALFEDAMKRAIDAGIPVMTYNSGDQRPAEENIGLIYIGQNEYLAGQQGAARLLAAGGTKGVCVNQGVGSTNLDQRCKGFTDAFEAAGKSADVLGISNDAAEAATTIGDYAAANPDVDTYLTLGPNGATPFYAFVEAEGLQGQLIHGTFDLGPEIVAHIKDGSTLFGIDQQPYIQGYMIVQWLSWGIRYGLSTPANILTGPGFVDSGNVEQVESLAGKYR